MPPAIPHPEKHYKALLQRNAQDRWDNADFNINLLQIPLTRMDMTADALRQICKENNLYQTPELNETLFCSLKGFKNIADLERYTDLKALFLDGNALQHLEGIPILSKLRCL